MIPIFDAEDQRAQTSDRCRSALPTNQAHRLDGKGEWPFIMADHLHDSTSGITAAKSVFNGLFLVPLTAFGASHRRNDYLWINDTLVAAYVMACRDNLFMRQWRSGARIFWMKHGPIISEPEKISNCAGLGFIHFEKWIVGLSALFPFRLSQFSVDCEKLIKANARKG